MHTFKPGTSQHVQVNDKTITTHLTVEIQKLSETVSSYSLQIDRKYRLERNNIWCKSLLLLYLSYSNLSFKTVHESFIGDDPSLKWPHFGYTMSCQLCNANNNYLV